MESRYCTVPPYIVCTVGNSGITERDYTGHEEQPDVQNTVGMLA